ncbi:Conserved_hypothetical protein [Hexamita inflata]|uniref:Uncharacterized protein n=1 Tax=Hexamita inflata TaxID=28002 RepID=A0AA86NTG5_9EUKA|nr:Conserved hypothetical protein [Hexamita inflata]
MIEKYQSQIQDGTLQIQGNPDLKSLDFMKFLVIYKLLLTCCKNIIPKLESQTIQKLIITDCKIQGIQDFQLENLEVLEIYNYFEQLESKKLILEVAMLQKLKELTLYKCITDFSPLSQMTGLTKLSLIDCKLLSTEALRPLVHLEELCLNGNDIDITSLQYQTKLTILQLISCNLVNIDALRPLVNLKELKLDFNEQVNITTVHYQNNLTKLSLVFCNLVSLDALRPLKKLEELIIFDNKIVYLQPLMELKDLSLLDARNNKIIDLQAIQLHPNFNSFILDYQNQPTQEELEEANILRDINSPITFLKQLCQQLSHIQNKNVFFRQKITQMLQQSYNSHEQFVAQAAILFKKINMFDGCQ